MPNISLSCNSLLLETSLKYMLKDRISKNASLIISDHEIDTNKPVLIIGKHIPKPFTKADLFLMLEKFRKVDALKSSTKELLGKRDSSVEKEIEILTEKFTKELLDLIQKRAK